MKKKLYDCQDNTGATTIVVICVMAVIMALSMGLFLTASVLTRTSGRTLAAEQSRILAVSFSEEVEGMLTSSEYAYDQRDDEEAGRAETLSGSSIWHYVKQNISDGTWPYYSEIEGSIHNRENAVRSFRMTESGTTGEIADIALSMYWTQEEKSGKPGQLVVETTASIKGQSCTIVDVYELGTTAHEDYQGWNWKHIQKR